MQLAALWAPSKKACAGILWSSGYGSCRQRALHSLFREPTGGKSRHPTRSSLLQQQFLGFCSYGSCKTSHLSLHQHAQPRLQGNVQQQQVTAAARRLRAAAAMTAAVTTATAAAAAGGTKVSVHGRQHPFNHTRSTRMSQAARPGHSHERMNESCTPSQREYTQSKGLRPVKRLYAQSKGCTPSQNGVKTEYAQSKGVQPPTCQ